jgi:hypothetical protein
MNKVSPTKAVSSLDGPDHRLAARVNMDMLDCHLLLALAAMLVQRVEQRRPSAGQLVRLVEILAPALEGLLPDHGAAVAFHRGVVSRDQLRRHHALQFILRADASQPGDGGAQLAVPFRRIRVLHPQRLHRLVGQRVVPVVGL